MSNGLLDVLRYFLLALIWLFFLYAARVVILEVRRGRTESSPEGPPAPVEARSERRAPLQLRIIEPEELRNQAFELGSDITLGRSADCVVRLPDDTYASSRHARVFVQNNELWVEDLGSTNGTYVNNRRLRAPVRLKAGDRIKVGSTVLELAR